MSIVYGVTTVFSFLFLILYCTLLKKKEILNEALLANRISYLGSVILPLAMLMIIKNSCNIQYRKSVIIGITIISILVFLIAASPGYLDIYYKSVSLEIVNGVSVLNKEYGNWHSIYLVYLLGYFLAMISTIAYSISKKSRHQYKR